LDLFPNIIYRRDGVKPFRKCEEWVSCKAEGVNFLRLGYFLTYFLSQLLLCYWIDQMDEIDKTDKIGGIDKTDHPF